MITTNIDKYLISDFWNDSSYIDFSQCIESEIVKTSIPPGSVLFTTSGSSGGKKWVVHTRETLLASAQCVINHLRVKATDCWLIAIPVNHVGGFGILARSYLSSCSVVYLNSRWNVKNTVKAIEAKSVTITSFVPAQIVDIIRENVMCPASIRAVVVGGGKLEKKVKDKARKLGWPILESYGMTETGSQIATQQTLFNKELSLIDGWKVKQSESNTLMVRGPGLMKGYLCYENGEYTFVEPFDEEGWFQTSDIVDIYGDQRMFLRFKSRADRVVKILGELVNLDLLEVEISKKLESPLYIIDIPDERRGVKLVPLMQRADYSETMIPVLTQGGLSKFEPVVLCEVFARNEMGKIDRAKLRESVVFSPD